MHSAALKQQMEKDVDEVGKIARSIKSKLEGLDREVRRYTSSFIEVYPSDSPEKDISSSFLSRTWRIDKRLDVGKDQG